MADIVPRWEWRTFGDHFGAAEATLSGITPERLRSILAGLFDVKLT